ncbi:Calcium/calmodulin-dependent 3',5'-cyclic nucleotide phosphodiesterase, partial [Globisporangium splendens]
MIAPYRSARNFDSASNYLSMRRSSLGVPLSSLIFPRSAADRHESIKLTRATEEKYGFHYFTNTFCLNPLVEMDFQAYYTETNILPACYASMISWVLWLALSALDIVALFSQDNDERRFGRLQLLVSIIVLVPVPILVFCCRTERFCGYEQVILCTIVHCFGVAIMVGGAIAMVEKNRAFLLKDMEQLLDTLVTSSAELLKSNSTDASVAAISSTQIYHLDDESSWWRYENIQGTARALIVRYLDNVILPIAQLNINLLRPLMILVIAPMFKLDTYHYILTAFNVNWSFCILVSMSYPQTTYVLFIVNKFLLVFCLIGVSMVMIFRVRQTDRFLRLNFLHAKTVEERARASHLQKEIIINENKSLKKMLDDRTRTASEPLDFDSPMSKVIMDLKNLQRTASLAPELRENLDGIVLLLSRKGQNLFAPDIHEQLRQKREGDLDGDTKGWAATVLANKSYTRNRRASAVFTNSPGSLDGSVAGGSHTTAGPNGERYVEVRLHPEVMAPSDEMLNTVGEMMERDGWSVDIFASQVVPSSNAISISELTGNKPISFITYIVFEQHNLFELCSVNKNILANFLYFLDIGYHRNPYHNNCHAADVVSSVEYLISVMDNGYIQDLLNYQEVFAAIIAAAVHDFRHPGKTNNFMVKSGSDLTIEYSDSSVLERMHLAEAFFLAKDPLFNIFAGMAPSLNSEVRKAIIEMVLSTDLSVHLQLVGSLKTALVSQETSDVIHSPMMLMKIVIKCADIGHSSKALKLHARWSDLIIEEFFLQGDDEQALGMDISPFMNRNNENSAKNQVGFFEFIILPFFEVVAEVVFRPEFKTILDQAHQNYKHWKKAEAQQINSIKDIMDQIFDVEGTGTNSSHDLGH